MGHTLQENLVPGGRLQVTPKQDFFVIVTNIDAM